MKPPSEGNQDSDRTQPRSQGLSSSRPSPGNEVATGPFTRRVRRLQKMEKVEKVIILNKKIKNSARAVHFFCIFLCRPYTSTTWKCPISLSMQPERVMFCAEIGPVLNLTNTVTDVQSTKLTLNLKQQEPINSEHFLYHSNHSHTDMQSDAVNPTRENSFFTWLNSWGQGVAFDRYCHDSWTSQPKPPWRIIVIHILIIFPF